jgi:hypothetical protein
MTTEFLDTSSSLPKRFGKSLWLQSTGHTVIQPPRGRGDSSRFHNIQFVRQSSFSIAFLLFVGLRGLEALLASK